MATSGYGCVLKRGDGGGPENFTTIAGITQLAFNGMKVSMVDITSMDSPSGWAEFLPTIKEGGQIQLDLNFLPQDGTQSHTNGMLKDFDNRTKRNFQLVLSDAGATTWAFAGYLEQFDVTAAVAGKLEAKATVRVTGVVTLT